MQPNNQLVESGLERPTDCLYTELVILFQVRTEVVMVQNDVLKDFLNSDFFNKLFKFLPFQLIFSNQRKDNSTE